MFVASLLRRSATAGPDRVAIVEGDRSIGYRELADRVARLASGLRSLALSPGNRVVDLQHNAAAYASVGEISDVLREVFGIHAAPRAREPARPGCGAAR
jgi:non-ribosomal peptide synthetase component E (peptide arylation enzyme)